LESDVPRRHGTLRAAPRALRSDSPPRLRLRSRHLLERLRAPTERRPREHARAMRFQGARLHRRRLLRRSPRLELVPPRPCAPPSPVCPAGGARRAPLAGGGAARTPAPPPRPLGVRLARTPKPRRTPPTSATPPAPPSRAATITSSFCPRRFATSGSRSGSR